MKKIIVRSILAVSLISALVISCEPMEPSTYTEDFYRFGTVQYKDNKASLHIDYSGETYYFTNFASQWDMDRFDVKDGDRVLAGMTLNAIGSIFDNKLTLNKVFKYPIYNLAQKQPSDSIDNFMYSMIQYKLNQNSAYTYITYPKAWCEGHLVNMVASYNISNENVEGNFSLYPVEFNDNNTLIMTLYSNIPDTLPAAYTKYTFLCYDMASMRDSIANPFERAKRDTILSRIEKTGQDTINVEIHEPDIMRSFYRYGDTVVERKFYNPRSYATLTIPFDF
ncbi:MAG: hypothetical protein IK038_00975 [Bacteroidaceae bacterium]|nr:hypothetical protein [Bacteroidaceae bacterium]